MCCLCCCCCCRSKGAKGYKMSKNGTIPKDARVYKEGFMEKKTGVLKLWKSRYFVLLDDLVCYYLREDQKESLTPSGRIFFSDIQSVDRADKKSHPFSLVIQTDHKKHLMSCSSYEEREEWVNRIWEGKEKHKTQERSDPVRRRSTRLGKDFKRITIKKDPQHGIGCTIKNVGGAIFVSRIIPDGPIATSGVLRPGDQVIDINGNRVSECPIEKIKEIIRSSPEYIVCTVKPVTHYKSNEDSPHFVRTAYTEVDPELLRQQSDEEEAPYTAVEFGTQQSVDEQKPLNAAKKQSVDEGPDYMNHEIVRDSNGHEEVRQKLTNYAELEFGAH